MVMQFVGVTLFLGTMLACCGSALLPKQWTTSAQWGQIGWQLGSNEPLRPRYSVQRAVTFAVTANVFFGVALAGLGLGLQAEYAGAAVGAVAVTALGAVFWIIHSIFAVQHAASLIVQAVAIVQAGAFLGLCGFAVAAWQNMRLHPPPRGHVLPPDYKVPYSQLHQDPPHIRLEAELEQRRQRLAVQQKELQLLEDRLRKSRENAEPGP
jgi:signal transduction histidine kinase